MLEYSWNLDMPLSELGIFMEDVLPYQGNLDKRLEFVTVLSRRFPSMPMVICHYFCKMAFERDLRT
jgi:hypothetical protein